MAVRSRDFVGIAEGIRSHELSTKSLIENLKGRISELSGRKSSLNGTISYLEAAIAAAYEDTDEDGDPDYGLIASLEAEKSSAENELSGVEQDLDSTGNELESKKNELEAVEEQKKQTLFEIQERARKTSQNINSAGGIAYASASSILQKSFQTSLSSLTQAAGILGGSIDGASIGMIGNSSSGSGRSASSESGTSSGVGNTETGALAAFTSKYTGEISPPPVSQFSTTQDQLSTPATMPNFHSGRGTINPKALQSFTSEQNANTYTLGSFAITQEDAPILPGVTEYLSGQVSQSAQCAFKSRNSQMQPNSGKTSVYEGNYRSAQETQGFSGFIDTTKTASMIARHGRNPFIDSLIVQDWELGRYSDSTMSSFRKQAAQSDYAAYIKNPSDYRHISYDKKPVIYIDPATINEIRGIDDPNFWSYKSTPYSSYIDMARQIPLVYSMAKAGQKLTDLAKRDDVIGACARNYFLNDDITVMRVGNCYVFGGEGRHRVMAALIAGVNIPVRVTDDFIKNENSAYEKSKAFIEKEHDSKVSKVCTTQIDNSVKDLPTQIVLDDSLKKTFLDEKYRTVITLEDIKLYRVYGGKAKKEGTFLTSQIPTDRMETKMNLALRGDWKNSREYFCEVIIPKGTILNIGRTAPQVTASGQVLPGGIDQIIVSKKFINENPYAFGSSKNLRFKTGYKKHEQKVKEIEKQIDIDNKKFVASVLNETNIKQNAFEELTDNLNEFANSTKEYLEISLVPTKLEDLDLSMAKADILQAGFNTVVISIFLLAATIKDYLKM